MLRILCFLLLFNLDLPSNDSTYRDTVDMIEINTYHDDDAFPSFTQIIFWEWDSFNHDWKVVAWKMHTKELWIKSEEHKKEWEKHLREYCDKNKHVDYAASLGKYKGQYSPIPGVNFPKRKKDRKWYFTFYHDGKRIEVKSTIIRETNTQTDPERDNRQKYPEGTRRGIRGFSQNVIIQ